MFTKLIYGNANFNIYTIDENCNVKKDGKLLSSDDIIYHSTNGYDYIMLEQFNGQLAIYPLDQVVWSLFHPNLRSLYQQFKCIHLNGELRDNRPDNLEAVHDAEEWRILTYPSARINRYAISNHGRLYNHELHQFVAAKKDVKSDRPGDFYIIYHLASYGCVKDVMAHRLVAYEFITHDIDGLVINHINGCKNDNNVLNLEICSHKNNNDHAHYLGLCPIGEELHNSTLTSNDVHIICEAIKCSRGDIPNSVKFLKECGFNKIEDEHLQDWIYTIKTGKVWKHISKDYFEPNELIWKKPTKFLTTDDVNVISKYLVKCNGNPKDTEAMLQSDGYSYISRKDVDNVRYKVHHERISDNWFILDDDRKFIPINKE